ncbi:MAG: esterase family protein [Pseudohongiella sp.]|jgi:enterochelin esterase-like enzyme|nr:esterase family protein [Pseudohongiella sp.]
MKNFSLLVLLLLARISQAQGDLSDNIRIESEALGYDLQYRVYVPDRVRRNAKLPVLYITDGQWYISQGKLPELLDSEITSGSIDPLIVVFVDSRNPDNLAENRRNRQFFCNQSYVDFFTNELLNKIDADYPTNPDREGRVILGLSFGGRNSACFGLMAHQSFAGIAMQSPANTEMVDDLTYQYRLQDKLPLKMFLSVGTQNDNTQAGRQFMQTLKFQEYDLTYREVDEGHDWDNWGPLLDDVLATFFTK